MIDYYCKQKSIQMIFAHTWENETIFHEAYVTDEKLDILLRTNKEPRQFIGPTHGPGF